jgi:hypothetical protein
MLAWQTPKAADEVLDYDVNWAARVASDTINSSVWSVEPGGDGALVVASYSFTNSETKVWLSAGTLGQEYHLRNLITTAGGRTMSQIAKLKIKEH